MSHLTQKIDELIKSTADISKQAELKEWDLVEDLTRQRQRQLEAFFSQSISEQDATQVADMIHQILAEDKKVVESIETERTQTFERFSDMQNNNKANKTYKKVATLLIP